MNPLPWLAALAAAAPTPETRQAVGKLAAVLMVLALVGTIAVCVLALIAARRKARARAAIDASGRPRPDRADPWAESARRVALEDSDGIPREPGTE